MRYSSILSGLMRSVVRTVGVAAIFASTLIPAALAWHAIGLPWAFPLVAGGVLGLACGAAGEAINSGKNDQDVTVTSWRNSRST